jgi:hypothetical protein
MTETDRLELEPDLAPAPEAPVVVGEFRSMLFGADGGDLAGPEEPAFFSDLNLDEVVEAVAAGRDEYELKPEGWQNSGQGGIGLLATFRRGCQLLTLA